MHACPLLTLSLPLNFLCRIWCAGRYQQVYVSNRITLSLTPPCLSTVCPLSGFRHKLTPFWHNTCRIHSLAKLTCLHLLKTPLFDFVMPSPPLYRRSPLMQGSVPTIQQPHFGMDVFYSTHAVAAPVYGNRGFTYPSFARGCYCAIAGLKPLLVPYANPSSR